MHRLPVLYQSETAECGLVCLAMIARFFGMPIDVFQLREKYRVSLKGLTLRSLLQVAKSIGMNGRAYRCSAAQLKDLRLPVMLHWDMEHLVVLKAVRGKVFRIHDPAIGALSLSLEELTESYSGVAVEFDLDQTFSSGQGRYTPFSVVRHLAASVRSELFRLVAVGLALGLVAESLALGIPFLLHKTVLDWLEVTSVRVPVAIILLAIFASLLTFMRDQAVRRMGIALGAGLADDIVTKHLALPVNFFEVRQHGHLVERYRAVEDLDQLLCGSFPLAIVDGVLATLALSLLAVASPACCILVASAVVIYAILRFGLSSRSRTLEARLSKARADESGLMVETLATVLSTKAHGLEQKRLADWRKASSRVRTAQEPIATQDSILKGVRILLAVAIVPIAALQLAGGQFNLILILLVGTLGLSRALYTVDRLADVERVTQRLRKLEDVLRTKPEADHFSADIAAPTGTITCTDLRFSYSIHDEPVLKSVTLDIASGDFVVITGQNGAGKSTLAKCLSGFYQATGGQLWLAGHPVNSTTLQALKRYVDLVMQDDKLFLGTIIENILGAESLDQERLDASIEAVDLKLVLSELPMGLNTKVGASICPLSVGQRQRITLARAIYRRPYILFLDEATCFLDESSEKLVLSNIAKLGCTTILITHRPHLALGFATQHLIVGEDGVRSVRVQLAETLCTQKNLDSLAVAELGHQIT